MVYDCFPFFNELDLLEIRLNTLNNVVDKFILVEATETFQGKRKPLYFKENKKRFEKFLDKIIYVSCEFPQKTQSSSWEREYYQRNKIVAGLLNATNDDWIILSDIDEIPSPPSIEEAKKIPNKITVFDQRFFLYFLNCENKNRWCGSVMFNYHYLQNHSPQDLRRIVVMCEALKHDRRFPYFFKTATEFIYLTRIKKMSIRITKNGGWHFTYIGNVKKISEKLHSFAHTELSTIANDEVSTEKMINAGINIFNGKKECHFVNIDKTFPVYLRRNIEKYIKFIKMNE